jgi:phage tail sheath protein FI
MPEYLAPGVYVEEVSFRSKSIEGVSTTTTGFIGPARYGPIDVEPGVITSLGEFERVYGDRQQLRFKTDNGQDAPPMHNYLWHAARAFFEEGGKRLYIQRVFRSASASDDGYADAWIPSSPIDEGDEDAIASLIRVRARFPGGAGKVRVRFTFRLGQSILGSAQGRPTVRSLLDRDIVWIGDLTSPVSSTIGTGTLYRASYSLENQAWSFISGGSQPNTLDLDSLNVDSGDSVRVLTLTVSTMPADGSELPQVWDGLPLDPEHARAGEADSVLALFAKKPSNLSQARSLPIVITRGKSIRDGLDVVDLLLAGHSDLLSALSNPKSTDEQRSFEVLLDGGNDGVRPGLTEYEGTDDEDQPFKTGLKAFEDIEDISIVAAPGSTFGYDADNYHDDAAAIINLLISHAERMRYRIAVLDSGDGQTIARVRALRAKLDSKYAALYYPWIRILDPVTRREIAVPPSGAVAGIYARNDINRAVYKAPANEVVNMALGFELLLNKSQQEVLNPEGINCFRFFEGRGYRLWGARTISSDPEWKYVNLRRYFAYLERSIDRGTQWAVFEPNGELLWANVRLTISDFLLDQWQNGALLGDKPEKAFFVKCDRSTMTQNDLDNGRLVCLIGVAPLRPAEFVIFRIGQWTADRRG